jgi:uncharacterized protein (TIGR03067 family)
MMYIRCLFALAVIAGLTAFAPAPFPREQRKARESDDAVRLMGTWKVTNYERPGVNGAAAMRYSVNMTIRLSPGKWEYVYDNNNGLGGLGRGAVATNNDYEMKIDTASMPRKMTMTKDYGAGTTMTMNAIYKFEGDKVKILYTTVYQGRGMIQAETGPLSWEKPPTNSILLTLERQK